MFKRFAGEYGCLMASLPEEIATMVRAYTALIDGDDISEKEDESHVTIKYGIHTLNPDDVFRVVYPCGAAAATLWGVSAFHNKDNIVLKIDVTSEVLNFMNEAVTDVLACTDKWPVFQPHITLAYLHHRPENPFYYRKYFTGVFDGVRVVFRDFVYSGPDEQEHWLHL